MNSWWQNLTRLKCSHQSGFWFLAKNILKYVESFSYYWDYLMSVWLTESEFLTLSNKVQKCLYIGFVCLSVHALTLVNVLQMS